MDNENKNPKWRLFLALSLITIGLAVFAATTLGMWSMTCNSGVEICRLGFSIFGLSFLELYLISFLSLGVGLVKFHMYFRKAR